MSRLTTSIRFALVAIMLLVAAIRPAAAQGYQDYDDYDGGGTASYQQFYDDLSPYGEWIDDPEYGYVWIPDAGDDFRPYYTNGYWANTEYGNTWVSNYDWGWAPFHYGRWTYSNYYGWLWIPGNEWGPAWVSWRSGGGAYGWAPLGPGISISMSFGNYYAPDYWWTFAPQQYVLTPNFHQYCYGPRYNSNYIHQTTIINNTYVRDRRTFIAGPRRSELERAIGRPVRPYAINNISRPDRAQVRGNNIALYRPEISGSRPRPTERPRQFVEAARPITAAPRTVTSAPEYLRSGRGDGNPRIQQQDQPIPMRGRTPVQQAPVTERPYGGRTPINTEPARGFDRQPARQMEMQQRNEQIQQRNEQMQQQRAAQMQQERMQQMQQQRSQQVEQERVQRQRNDLLQQQQRAEQMQQQREAQMQQQRNEQMAQQRMQQMQQQRAEQVQQQQRMQQMQQQRAEQAQQQQRMQQMQQQRAEQMAQQQRMQEMQQQRVERQAPVQRMEAPRNDAPARNNDRPGAGPFRR